MIKLFFDKKFHDANQKLNKNLKTKTNNKKKP